MFKNFMIAFLFVMIVVLGIDHIDRKIDVAFAQTNRIAEQDRAIKGLIWNAVYDRSFIWLCDQEGRQVGGRLTDINPRQYGVLSVEFLAEFDELGTLTGFEYPPPDYVEWLDDCP